jgi:hypothetical protein
MNTSLTPMARMLVCGGCLALPCLAGVTNITSGGFAHNTLTEAITWANYGDTLLVSVGTYHEHLTIVQKSLTFLGGYAANFSQRTHDPSLTIVDAGTNASVLHVANYCSVVLDCMTLTNGAAERGGGICVAHGLGPLHAVAVHMRTSVIACCTATCGGGIYVGSNSIVTLADTAVAGCTAAQGGGICATGQQVNVVLHGARTVLRGNTATEGGAVWAVGVTVAISSNASLHGNLAGERGGGAFVAQAVLVVDDHAAVLGNHAARSGGAIMVTNGTVVVRNGATIGDASGSVSNYAGGGGGGICAVDALVVLSNGACVSTCVAADGGGIMLWNSTGVFHQAGVCDNHATLAGGGVFAYLASVVRMSNAWLTGNHTDRDGGALYLQRVSGAVGVAETIITNNHAAGAGGAVYAHECTDLQWQAGCLACNTASVAGAALFHGCTSVVMTAVSVSSNRAPQYGGLALRTCQQFDLVDCAFVANMAVSGMAGAVFIEDSTGYLRSRDRAVLVQGNWAEQGGALVAVSNANLTILAARMLLNVHSNTAVHNGGGLWCATASSVVLAGAVLCDDNRAANGGALCGEDGCYVVAGPTNGNAPRFVGNVAQQSGGALALFNAATVTAINCTFDGNHAADAGGGICAEWSSVKVHGAFVPPPAGPPCVFVNNQATYGGACFFNIISDSRVRDALIVSNRATQTGGGVYATSGGHSYLCNCVVARNTAPRGAGVAAGLSTRWHADYCTFAHNSSAGVDWYAGVAGLTNCIVWGNVGTQITAGTTVSFCDVEGGYPGNGNLATDPQFRNPGALDWSLAGGSPCIDTAVNCGVTLDCRGALRPMGCGYDIGAYELDPRPVLGVTPTTLDFGAVQVGGATSLPLVIESQGNGWLTGTIDSVPVPIFSAAYYAYAVPPNAATNVLFTFAPPIVYAWTQTVRFVSNGGVADAVLLGTGVPEPAGLGLLLLLTSYNVQITIWRKRQRGH